SLVSAIARPNVLLPTPASPHSATPRRPESARRGVHPSTSSLVSPTNGQPDTGNTPRPPRTGTPDTHSGKMLRHRQISSRRNTPTDALSTTLTARLAVRR